MKTTRNILSLLVVSLLIGLTGCSQQSKDQKLESAGLQGTWQGHAQGQDSSTGTLVMFGKNLEFRSGNGQEWYKGTFVLNQNATPKQMIVTITDCAFPKYVGKTANAIYRIENGTLTIAANEPGNAAVPASFDAQGVSCMDFKLQ